ncbi:hypothetical protein [Vulgatibacter sp.]|uniref:hypothetical protein n=1 Tax=Vulgatibacter sp. TaxID=1971226 RepID=UPI0035658DBE
MRIAMKDVDVKLQIPGAVIRLEENFGEAGDFGSMSAEHFSLAKGVDTTQLFVGLDGDLCQCPHWGYVVKGVVTTTDGAGREETVRANDLFYWPAGHNVKVLEDAELIMFSPQQPHMQVVDHMREKVRAGG